MTVWNMKVKFLEVKVRRKQGERVPQFSQTKCFFAAQKMPLLPTPVLYCSPLKTRLLHEFLGTWFFQTEHGKNITLGPQVLKKIQFRGVWALWVLVEPTGKEQTTACGRHIAKM